MPGDHTGKQCPAVYAVDLWQWVLTDGALVPRELARQCVDGIAADEPFPCDSAKQR